MAKNARGQAALEYLIGLALVLILAFVALSLLGIIPSFVILSGNQPSKTYWTANARPFAAVDSMYEEGNSRGYIAFENMMDEPLNLTSIYVNGTQVGYYEYNETYSENKGSSALQTPGCTPPDCIYNILVGPRALQRIVTDPFMSADQICGAGGQEGKVPLTIGYTRPNATNNFTETGQDGLVFTCVRS